MARKYSEGAERKVKKVMKERKGGTLKERPLRQKGEEPQASDSHRPRGARVEPYASIQNHRGKFHGITAMQTGIVTA